LKDVPTYNIIGWNWKVYAFPCNYYGLLEFKRIKPIWVHNLHLVKISLVFEDVWTSNVIEWYWIFPYFNCMEKYTHFHATIVEYHNLKECDLHEFRIFIRWKFIQSSKIFLFKLQLNGIKLLPTWIFWKSVLNQNVRTKDVYLRPNPM